MAQARLQREFEEMSKRPPPLCSAGPIARDLYNWQAFITGPPRSPYEGGIFKINLNFPPNYPSVPPRATFATKIYHMNINESGGICLDILKNKWNSNITIAKLLLALCNLLSNPNPEDPLDGSKCAVWKSNRGEYNQNAQQWTKVYAKKL